MTKKIHLWIPNIFEFKGGIQVYCAFVLSAIQEILSDINYSSFLKNDTRVIKLADFSLNEDFNFKFFGQYPLFSRTIIFSLQLFISGLIQKPNLILCFHVNFTPVAYLLKILTGIPFWTFIYGVDVWDIKNPLIKKALANSDRILSIGTYTNSRLLEKENIDKKIINLLPCTFHEDKFNIAPKPKYLLDKYKMKADQPVILTITRLAGEDRYKGYDQIIRALPNIIKTLPDVHYLIGGKGGDKARIEQLIKDLNLENHVTLAGFIPDEELCDYYNLCDVFAMPSKGEGFGIVYLEALACGKPTLGGNQDGALDALCHGELGALVNPDDIEDIANTLITILQGNYPNPLMYQPEKLREKVIEIYGFEKFKATLGSYLKEIV